MRGDLSTRYGGADSNFNGVLYQQGRVFLDRDGNAQTGITTEWQDLAGRDAIGSGVAAAPGEESESFRIEDASLAAGEVTLTVHPGRIWADGMLVRLDGTPPITRLVRYLEPPLQDPSFDETTIAAGVRDAVVLELWRGEVNGFQLPETLIEPALGGVDTTERLFTGVDFRLFRLDEGDTCESIVGKLGDDFSAKGKLKVTLQPTVVTVGDCPVVEGGGYTGFEHDLYRIEIAATDGGQRMFKWSQFNGGLVGRGVFDAGTQRVTITANLAPIVTSELTDVYLEAVEWDFAAGRWTVTYGAKVTLAGDQLILPAVPTFGAVPAGANPVFFRLWNDIRAIADFPASANPTELVDGIRLEFESDAAGKYVPEDYWTFPVRAGGIGNPEVLVDSAPPEGIHYHRVPIAVLSWDGTAELTPAKGTIEDCRRVFHPLTRLGTCCTFRVGDGLISHGDFASIQAAIDALPPEGGKICVLPGTYLENILIDGRRNIVVSGCGRRSKLAPPPRPRRAAADPAIHVRNSRSVGIEHLALAADLDGIGVLLEPGETAAGELDAAPSGVREDVVLEDLFVTAARRSAIECHGGIGVVIRDCVIWTADRAGTWPGIFFVGQDGSIERNSVLVVVEDEPTSPGRPVTAGGALGGIQLGGNCERVDVVENLIQGGVGNGVTLGSIAVVDDEGRDTGEWLGWVVNADDPCSPCRPGDTEIPEHGRDDGTRHVSAGPLREIVIEHNHIYDMGLNGIGVIGFFALERSPEVVSVYGLRIVENVIRRCLQRSLAPIRQELEDALGYGGIALADVAFLEIRENLIEDNGPDHLEPVCGIFLLHGEGVEISLNRILNNGAKTGQPAAGAKPGPRGGIYIALCTAPLTEDRASAPARAAGGSALRVQENRVVAPLGRALTATALGDVSVHGNHLTSLGVATRDQEGGLPAAPTTAMIRELRGSPLVGRSVSYEAVRMGTQAANLETGNVDRVSLDRSGSASRLPALTDEGRVLFTDNQVALEVLEETRIQALASIGISSLDDVGFHDNQCRVELQEGLLLTNLWAFGVSLRVGDNRLSEGLPNALFSGVTHGLMNMTTHNQATHCLLIRGWTGTGLVVNKPNTILISAIQPAFCESFAEVLRTFGSRVRG